MSFDNEFFVTFAFTILNIVVLYIILRKLLFKPVTKHMDNRSKKIQEALDAAEESKEMVRQMKIEYDEKIKAAKEFDCADEIIDLTKYQHPEKIFIDFILSISKYLKAFIELSVPRRYVLLFSVFIYSPVS